LITLIEEEKMVLSKIFPNPDQPRKLFREESLRELAQSIKENGLLEPIVVTPRPDGYMIIAGERRFRACRIAGLRDIPVRVIEADDLEVAKLAMLENLQREDLNLIEEAKGYRHLLDMGFTQDQIARKLGFKQPWRIQERLNLLKLDEPFQEALTKKIITPSQAYEMSRLCKSNQWILFNLIREGKVTRNDELHKISAALLMKEQQKALFEPMGEEEKAIKNKYDTMIETALRVIVKSFDKQNLSILSSVIDSSIEANLQKLDLIIDHLNKIKKALTEAGAKQMVITA
jgi:ParB family transcriptional regulator, chromosome partitioning protein